MISSAEVPQFMYKIIMDENPSRQIGNQKPVESVTWFEACTFCHKLSLITGQKVNAASYVDNELTRWHGWSPCQEVASVQSHLRRRATCLIHCGSPAVTAEQSDCLNAWHR